PAVQGLDPRGEAVRRAGSVRHDLVLRRIERVVVHADDERGVDVLAGRGDDHERRTRLQVEAGLLPRGEQPGRFDDDVDPELAPRERRRVALGDDLQRVAVDLDPVADDLDVAGVGAEDRVVRQQVRHQLARQQVVRCDEVDVGAPLLGRAEEVPPDPAEPVDPYLDRHGALPVARAHPMLSSRSGQAWGRSAQPRSRSRWTTITGRPRSRKYAPSASATTIERWWPPVQPTETVR